MNIAAILLAVLSFALAGYALMCVCRARQLGKDPRPFALPVFSLLAFALMQVVLFASDAVNTHNDTLIAVWLAVEYSQLLSIAWLLKHASRKC